MRWSEPALLALLGVLAAVVSAASTVWARRYALRRGLLDQPGARRSHAVPTPRGGGIGIVIASLICLALLGVFADDTWWWFAVGLLLVAAAGWWDDHRPTSPALRLGVHALAAACVCVALMLEGAAPLAAGLGFLLAIAMVNVWNFMDGIDGLAGSQAGLCAVALLILSSGPVAALAVVLAAACLGFLPFNLPPARIFLGDVGSGPVGYLLAVLMALVAMEATPARWLLLLLPPSAFLLDAAMTLGWRILRGERWWSPHVEHLYQRASRRFGHGRVAIAYAGWTIAATGVMLAAMQAPSAWRVGAGVLMLGMGTWLVLHRRWGGITQGFGA